MSDTLFPVAVIMERVAIEHRWATERWQAKGVVIDTAEAGRAANVMLEDAQHTEILFRGFQLRLMLDEAQGYYLNISSPQPRVFVLWRMHDAGAQPEFVTVSYEEAARWMDAGENVDAVAMPVAMQPWLGRFVERHYRPEPLRKRWRT